MPRKQKLKVYRTPAGFYDAYVAAPSQKAALDAWGSDRDLFARGIAEQVTDEAVMQEPLDNPGTIVRRSRGTATDHLAALPPESARKRGATNPRVPATPSPDRATAGAAPPAPDPPSAPAKKKAKPRPEQPKPKVKPKPPPDPATRDTARTALEAAKRQFRDQRAALKRRANQLAKDQRALDKAEQSALAKLTRARETAETAYDQALRTWKMRR